jgi:putative IMPACT (imprinted ancient) family translation regulator
LISAYKTAAALVLQTLPSVKKNIEEEIRLEFDYTLINVMMTLVKQNSCRIVSQELELFCNMHIAVPKNKAEQVTRIFKGLHNVGVIKIGSI